jgi:hypothetical protein
MKIGQLLITSGTLQFIQYPYSEIQKKHSKIQVKQPQSNLVTTKNLHKLNGPKNIFDITSNKFSLDSTTLTQLMMKPSQRSKSSLNNSMNLNSDYHTSMSSKTFYNTPLINNLNKEVAKEFSR